MKAYKKGFTLIELLVVIAIIGILSSVVVASLSTARLKARDAKRISDVKQIQLALEMSNDKNGSYPATLASLQTDGFLSVIPADPNVTPAYQYAALGTGANCTSYHLGATLEDTNNAVLTSDRDAAAGTACTGSANDVAGTDPLYDVTP